MNELTYAFVAVAVICWIGFATIRAVRPQLVTSVRRFNPRLRAGLIRAQRWMERLMLAVLSAYTLFLILPPYPEWLVGQVAGWTSTVAAYLAIRTSRQAYEAAAA